AVRAALLAGGRHVDGVRIHDGGTVVVIDGPRFSTRAESVWFSTMGWDVVNMTNHPESVLAAEAGIPYGTVALVTDRDAGQHDGSDDDAPVTMEAVMAVVAQNVDNVKRLLAATVPLLP
ncbi:MAG: S-methyl-5'-thioadenosine phosphorylase, partial [Ilumatobacter sp.]